ALPISAVRTAAAMRSRTAARLPAIWLTTSNCEPRTIDAEALLDAGENVLRRLGVLAGRRELQIRFEVFFRVGGLPFVHDGHAQPVVRFGHVRIDLHRLLELGLCFRDFSGVPEDDPLIEDRRGASP